jgi:hypothetical protein
MDNTAQTLFAQTLRLALRIAIVWAGGFVIAVAMRALVPDEAGFTLADGQSTRFISYSRIAFWTCLLAALTVSGLVVLRSMIVDLGLRGQR